MNPERWQQYKQIVASLLERDKQEWPARLVALCGDDADLFLDASALLAASRAMGDFIEAPAWHLLSSHPNRQNPGVN